MGNSNQLLAAADRYLGRPWVKGKADCVVLVKDAYSAAGLPFPMVDTGPRPTTVSNLYNRFRGTKLHAAGNTPKAGNLLIFNLGGKMVHVGIARSATTMISAVDSGVSNSTIAAVRPETLAFILEDPNVTPVAPDVPAHQTYTVWTATTIRELARVLGCNPRVLIRINQGTAGLSDAAGSSLDQHVPAGTVLNLPG